MTESIRLDAVTKRYNDVTAVRDVSLSASKGEVLGILGPSGAGKSTLLRLIDLLEAPDSGSVVIHEKPVDVNTKQAAELRRNIGMVLQKPVALNRSVENNLAYALRIRGWDENNVVDRVRAEMNRFGLVDRKHKNARTLSGGEMQRLCFARVMIHSPDILLLDEFAANLDPANVALLEERVRQYAAEDSRRSIVLVTHNLFQAKRMCDRIALMWGGEIVEVATKKKFFENPDDERTAAFVKGELVY
ncbi:MAG: phosphate ABC transporter ATP-binding protein [Thermoplasmatota archaeon]|nr:phosphate ABC transporter ATP-binding protein [Candidatus Thermoplasmatota archaeon]MBU1915009.1 phosphate ABC transporter ATP-binding protein [Candidatus Thermoplasmatota archaeon]